MLNVSFKLLTCIINHRFLGSESLQKDHNRALFDWWFCMKSSDDWHFTKTVTNSSPFYRLFGTIQV